MTTCQFIGGGGPVEVEYLGVTDMLTGNISTSVSFGDAAPSRVIVLGVTAQNNGAGNSSITAATIGGVSATTLVVQNNPVNPAVGRMYWIAAQVPTGTSGTVAITFTNGSGANARIAAYRCLNVQSLAAFDADSQAWDFDGSVHSLSIDVPKGGAVFAGASFQRTGGAQFTAGIGSEDYDEGILSGAYRGIGGHELTPNAGTMNITLARTLTDGDWQGAYAGFSIR